MPNNHTYTFRLRLNSHQHLVMPIDLGVHKGDIVIWRLKSGTAITGIKITGNGAPFENPLSTNYAPVVWGIIRQDGIPDNYEWEYHIAITTAKDSIISIDPKIKVKPSSHGINMLIIALVIGATAIFGFFGKKIYSKIKALF